MTTIIDVRQVTIYVITMDHQFYGVRLPRWLAEWLQQEFGGARTWLEAQANSLARYQRACGISAPLSQPALRRALHATALESFGRKECLDF